MTVNSFNAARMAATVFTPDGAAHETTRLNAIDLVRHSGYSWKSPREQEKIAEAVVAVDAALAPDEEPTPAAEPAPVEADPLDPASSSLRDLAERVIGEADIEKYLRGFSAEALRGLAEERYGEKLHHRVGKETAIEKIVGLEEAKLDAEE